MQVPPGGGPPPHAHPSFHESFYVVEGEIEFKTEVDRHIAKKGDLVNKSGSGKKRMKLTVQLSNLFSKFFEEEDPTCQHVPETAK